MSEWYDVGGLWGDSVASSPVQTQDDGSWMDWWDGALDTVSKTADTWFDIDSQGDQAGLDAATQTKVARVDATGILGGNFCFLALVALVVAVAAIFLKK